MKFNVTWLLLTLVAGCLSSAALAQDESDETLIFRDSCVAVASAMVSSAAKSNSVDSLRSNSKGAYLKLASESGIKVLPLHRIEEPIDILINVYGGLILDEIRGSMFSVNLDTFVQGTGFAMASTSATCMAILLE